MDFRKLVFYLSFLILAIIFISGCSPSQLSNSPNTNSIAITPPGAITVTAPSSGTPKPFIQAPIIINKNSDGQVIHANLVKFTGSVSSPNINVTVNNVQATVNTDGNYYAYLDLKPGKNNIEIKTTKNQNTTAEKITVTFIPPLIVLLNWPNREGNVDYRKSPITLTGSVSDPSAKVEVNNQQAIVNPDGDYTVQVQLHQGPDNYINVLATRGNETDSASLKIGVFEGGGLEPAPPGFGSEYTSSFVFNNPKINLKTGQATTVDFVYRANKDIPFNGRDYNASLIRRSGSSSQDTLSALPGLNVYIIPSRFTVFPKIDYLSQINIQTSSYLNPGDYYFSVSANFGKAGFPNFQFTVSIEK